MEAGWYGRLEHAGEAPTPKAAVPTPLDVELGCGRTRTANHARSSAVAPAPNAAGPHACSKAPEARQDGPHVTSAARVLPFSSPSASDELAVIAPAPSDLLVSAAPEPAAASVAPSIQSTPRFASAPPAATPRKSIEPPLGESSAVAGAVADSSYSPDLLRRTLTLTRLSPDVKKKRRAEHKRSDTEKKAMEDLTHAKHERLLEEASSMAVLVTRADRRALLIGHFFFFGAGTSDCSRLLLIAHRPLLLLWRRHVLPSQSYGLIHPPSASPLLTPPRPPSSSPLGLPSSLSFLTLGFTPSPPHPTAARPSLLGAGIGGMMFLLWVSGMSKHPTDVFSRCF